MLDTLQSKEKQVKTTEGKWFQMRILPYRTSENRIDGLVVTFSDITAIKQLELSIQDARNYAESIIATVLEPLVVLNADLRVVSANRSFYTTLPCSPGGDGRKAPLLHRKRPVGFAGAPLAFSTIFSKRIPSLKATR